MNNNKVIKTLTLIGEIVGGVFIFLYVYIYIVSNPIKNLDELWSFNTAKCIAQGLIPYKDISMITTPLAQSIVAILMKLLGISLLNYRVIVSIMVTLLFFSLYSLLSYLTKKNVLSGAVVLFLVSFFIKYHSFDYNYLSVMLFLWLELIEIITIKKYHEGKKDNYVLTFVNGLLIGLLLITKHTTGALIAAGLFVTPLLFLENCDKKDIIKILAIKIAGALIPVIAFGIFLLSTNSLNDFIDYCFYGVRNFSNKVSFFYTIKANYKAKEYINASYAIVIFVSAILLIIVLITNFIKIIRKKEKLTETLLIKSALVYFALISLVFIYPIADIGHILFSSYFIIVAIVYLITSLFDTEKEKSKLITVIEVLVYIIIITLIIVNDWDMSNKTIVNNQKYQNCNLNYYKSLALGNDKEETVIEIDDFIEKNEAEGKKVYIVDASAAFYEIPIDKYNKNYSMFLNGNIGKEGSNGIIKTIEQEENAIYLVLNKKFKLNWQLPKEVIEYIRNNLKQQGSVGIFDYYTK